MAPRETPPRRPVDTLAGVGQTVALHVLHIQHAKQRIGQVTDCENGRLHTVKDLRKTWLVRLMTRRYQCAARVRLAQAIWRLVGSLRPKINEQPGQMHALPRCRRRATYGRRNATAGATGWMDFPGICPEPSPPAHSTSSTPPGPQRNASTGGWGTAGAAVWPRFDAVRRGGLLLTPVAPILRRPPKPPSAAEGYAEPPFVTRRSFGAGGRTKPGSEQRWHPTCTMSRIGDKESPAPPLAIARWHFWACSVLLLLGMAVLARYLYLSQAGRFVRGVSTVAVANESGIPLHAVRWELTDSSGTILAGEVAALGNGEVHAIPVHTSDLIVRSVRFTLGQDTHEYLNVGLAWRGTVFIIAIAPDGAIRTRFGQ